ncbi:hypothetical protein [Roseovarius nanhaiticus]|uniref:hypothetical protein n=1 Tax=Roseovarius nanhaiticus TaxID=573024 RepID=UPI002493821D|nr:hypothetical protein [Roseovarius nanhaiticus]
MKPNFSLILSSEGLELLHRTYSGWARVGQVAFDVADLPAAISALQDRAAPLPGDRTCKLVLPDDQIKYLTIEADGDVDAAVRAALDGATPYAVDDLEYDWTAENGTIHIAAVALETLGEAESFAVEHGFEPVSFAATPETELYRGEPFFGATAWAAANLPEGTVIERDAERVRITGEAEISSKAHAPEKPAEPQDTPVAAAATKAVAEAGPAPKVEKSGAASAADTPKTAPSANPAPTKAPIANGNDGPAAAPASFTSIRASRGGDDAPRLSPKLAAEPRLSRLGGADTGPSADAGAGATPSLPSPADQGPTDPALMAELAASLRPDPEARLDRDAAPEPQAPKTDPLQNGSAAKEPGKMPGLFGSRAPKSQPRATPSKHDEKQRMTVFGARQTEVRGKPRFLGLILTAILLLFLVGVAAWASVFLDEGLSRFFRGSDIKLADVPAVSETEEDPAAQPSEDAAPALIAPLPSGDGDGRVAALPRETAPPVDVATLPDSPTPLSPSEALASYAATGIWQMAPLPPETPGAGAPITELYQVSLDPGVDLGLPGKLPRRAPDVRDTAPEAAGTPPPAGMRFDFDERGFVRATPDGVLTPEGVRVVAGRPPLMPPADMAQSVTVIAEVPAPATQDGAAPAQTETVVFKGDPALAGTRPRVRPQSIVAGQQPGEDEESDAGALAEVPEVELAETTGAAASLAALRPQLRPESMTAAAATLRTASAADTAPLVDGASLSRAIAAASAQPDVAVAATTEAEQEALDDDAFENVTPQAVTASLTPLRRPGDFESLVKRTQRQAAAQPVPQAQRMQVSLPSSASVASQATDKDVLNMRDVNLIGVYGSSASRRALVRLSNGRYKKVRVGDTLDGGQVAAIGESELRYIKRGRNVVLRMPKG